MDDQRYRASNRAELWQIRAAANDASSGLHAGQKLLPGAPGDSVQAPFRQRSDDGAAIALAQPVDGARAVAALHPDAS
ncbi:MAG: hypothetical protein J0J15_01755, partial [Mesorhizobium sp.]|nr:hypothetical protein [Mesorhizobium sp.]